MNRLHHPSSRILITVIAALLLLAACVKTPGVAGGTATPDPCAPENIIAEATGVNDLMREFDDAAQLASHVSRDQLVSVIPSMQEIRRRAEDQTVPSCLDKLKTLQITHMDTVINTLLAFVSGTSSDQLVQGIAVARAQHEDYNQELARMLGATYVPPATQPSGPTSTPAAAEDTSVPSATAFTVVAFVTNPGPGPVNIRAEPRADADVLAMLDANLSMPAVGKTADGQWIQVMDSQGNTGWIYAAIVTVTGAQNLPVVTPAP
jgi:hypothetical protein